MTTLQHPPFSREHVAQPNNSYHPQAGLLLVIVQGYASQAMLFRVPIHQSNPTGSQLEKMHDLMTPYWFATPLTRYTIGKARIVEVSLKTRHDGQSLNAILQIPRQHLDLPAAEGLQVRFDDFREDLSLTEGFQNIRSFLQRLGSDVVDIEECLTYQDVISLKLQGREAVMIRLCLDKPRVVWCLLILLVILLLVGVPIGVASHSVGTGVAASTGLMVLVPLLQVLAAWFQH